jgi:hypothetical protein
VDWASAASLATAAGTLVLAVATFAAVRSANRAARAAEQSLLAGLRPLLVSSRLQDPAQKVSFVEAKWLSLPGGGAAAEAGDGVVYLAASVRNVGPGIAILHGWCFYPDIDPGRPRPRLSDFRRHGRDLYIAPGETGFWQGAFRDPAEPGYGPAREAVLAAAPMSVDILYGDYEGGQRVISRFAMNPRTDGGWLLTVARHWNVDRPSPRSEEGQEESGMPRPARGPARGGRQRTGAPAS